VVFYLNGTELLRDNMSNGIIAWSTVSSNTVSGADETTWFTRTSGVALLLLNTNVLAAEVHQCNNNSSDLAFALELSATRHAFPLVGPGPRFTAEYSPVSPAPQFRFFGQPGRQYRLLGSTNLLDWDPVQTFAGAGALIYYTRHSRSRPPVFTAWNRRKPSSGAGNWVLCPGRGFAFLSAAPTESV